MRILDKFLLFIYSFLFMIVSFAAIIFATGFFSFELIYNALNIFYSNYNLQLATIVLGIILFILSFNFLIKSIKVNKVTSYYNSRSDIGDIKISIDTLENMASKITSKVKGVREQKVRVRIEKNENVSLAIKIIVDGETPIPRISEEIQQKVKENLEQIAGISVEQVHIVVSNISQIQTKKARVE